MAGSSRAGAGGPRAKGRAPHRRSDRARIAVLHAADDLLVERGYAGVTIQAAWVMLQAAPRRERAVMPRKAPTARGQGTPADLAS